MSVARPLPTIEELLEIPQLLKDSYLRGNPVRVEFINFLREFLNLPELLAHPDARDIMHGACLFIASLIYEEDWEPVEGWKCFSNDGGWFNTGSTLLQPLNTKICNTPNDRIPQDVQLNLINRFNMFLESHFEKGGSDKFLVGSAWQGKKQVLMDKVLNILQKTLYRQRANVKKLEEARPVPEQLRLNLKDVKKRLLEASPKSTHADDAEFIDFLYAYCLKKDAQNKCISQESDDTRYAIVLFCLMNLETAYKSYSRVTFGLWNAGNTNFHDIIAKDTGINLKSTDSLTPAQIVPLLAILLYQLGNIKEDEAFLVEAENNGYKNVRKALDDYYTNVTAKWNELTMVEKGGLHGKVKHVIKGVTKFTFSMALKTAVLAAIPAAFVLAPGATLGTAYAIFIGGQFVGTTAAALLLSYGLPALANGILHEGFEGASDKFANTGATVVLYPFEVTTGLLSYFVSSPKKKEITAAELRANKAFVETLYLLPPKIFKEESKRTIENTSGIQRPRPPAPKTAPLLLGSTPAPAPLVRKM